jgi:hypothetical protein
MLPKLLFKLSIFVLLLTEPRIVVIVDCCFYLCPSTGLLGSPIALLRDLTDPDLLLTNPGLTTDPLGLAYKLFSLSPFFLLLSPIRFVSILAPITGPIVYLLWLLYL